MIGRRNSGEGRRSARQGGGWSPLRVGAVVLAVLAVGTFLGFTKDIPFTSGYRLKAVFPSANSIKPGSPVRIAGVNVGKVKKVSPAEGRSAAASVVEMELIKQALPIHRDAELKIRPRIFLEGNFFVDLRPGTASEPTVDSGHTIPITQTANAVQLDEVLTALQSDAREDLKDVLDAFGTGLSYRPTAADDIGQDPDVHGETAAKSLNDSYRYSGDAFKSASQVNQAVLGTEPHDLSKLIAGFQKVAAALDRNEVQLQDLITNFNVTMAAFASEDANLRSTIRLLAPTLRNANRAFASLNRAFPPTRAFAREIIPGIRETPETINAFFPWARQVRPLLGPRELGGLAEALRPTSANLARLTDESLRLFPQINLISRCATEVVLPTGDQVIEDGELSTGEENYKEFWYTMVGLAGEGQNFDGNGMYVRFQPGGGPSTVSTGEASFSGERLFGNARTRPLGTRPKYPGKRPPYRSDVPCHTNRQPDLNGPAAEVGPVESQVRVDRAPRPFEPRATAPGADSDRPPTPLEDALSHLNPFGDAGTKAKGARKPAESRTGQGASR